MKLKLTKLLFITAVFGCFLFGVSGIASADWTTGKYNSAMDFNGTTTFVDGFGAIGNIKTVCFWVKASDITAHTDYVVDLNGTDYIKIVDGEVTVNNISSPTYYVNAVSGEQTISDTTSWFHIAVTTDTAVSATTAATIGKVTTVGFFTGTLDEVKIYAYARTAEEILLDYNAGVATHLGPSGKTCAEDPAGCMDYGLVGSWGMDEGAGTTTYDGSDNGNDGTLTNGPVWTTDSPPFQGGAGGGSLKFDGVNDYVDCGVDNSIKVSESGWTVESWIYPLTAENTVTGTRSVIYYAGSGGTWWIIIYGNDILFQELSSPYASLNAAKDNIQNNQWYHIVVTSSGTTKNIYVDGILIKTGTLSVSDATGAFISRSTDTFNGSIDQVRIYNRALSAEEVRYHYNKGGPVAEWKFDEGEGTTAFDSSINRNKGTLTNFGTTDSGTAESGGDDTLTDTDKAWTTDQWADGTINITGGTGSGQTRTVSSNTGTIITVSSNWTTNPDATSTYSLTQAPTWTSGKYGSGIRFDGKDDYVDAGNDASLNITDAITVEAWVKINAIQSTMQIVNKRNWNENYGYALVYRSSGQLTFEYGNGSAYDSVAYTTVPSLNRWYHISSTYDGTDINIYMDGVNVKTDSGGIGSIGINDKTVKISRYVAGSDFFNGSIDDVRIYNYARTAEQIQQDYNGGMGTRL